jgi:hypothetical protein
MAMQKFIQQSWSELTAGAPARRPEIVRFDFDGIFTHGTYEGTAFAGRIEYDSAAEPSEHHAAFAVYEDWPSPIVTIAIGGQVLSAVRATVYDRVFDGGDRHCDFVTMVGAGPFDQQDDAGSFELLFADEDGTTLKGTGMPDAPQLAAMPVKQVSFATTMSGNVSSRGDLILRPAS